MGEIIKKAVEKNWAFWICLGVSIVLIVGGALTPPPFVVDSSIFVGTGELFAFAALWVFWRAIEKGIDAKVKHGETELSIENPDPEDKEERHHHHDHYENN